MKLALIVIAYVVGAYFVVRAVVELAMINYREASSHRNDPFEIARSAGPHRRLGLDREIPDDPMPRRFRRTTDDDEQPRGSGLPNAATRILDATAGAVRGRQRRTRTSPNPCQMRGRAADPAVACRSGRS
jgi:hypothetical protein